MGPVDLVFIDAGHEYEELARDLFAIRASITAGSTLAGHDITLTDQWPGVRAAVDRFIKHYTVSANVWIADPQGVAHLLALPPYEQLAEEIHATDVQLRKRYDDPQYRMRYGIKDGG